MPPETEYRHLTRWTVVGTSGSGKTTFAHQLAARLNLPHTEQDALYWLPNWTEPSIAEFRSIISDFVQAEAWVLDGNSRKVRDLVWSRAQAVVWLDYSKAVVLRRVTVRTFQRVLLRQRLWADNREVWANLNPFRRESMIRYAWETHAKNRQRYEALFEGVDFPHLHYVRLSSPHHAQAWLDSL